MQKNPTFQSGLLNPRLLLAFILCSGSALLAMLGMAAPASIAPANKIAPWVLEHTANSSQAEFLIVLADQAVLSGAARLPTKGEKGRYVRDTLWNKAQATQGPLLQWLRERSIEHRSYYIVNLIWVKAGLEVVQALAARSDVLRIEGNPQIRNILPGSASTGQAPAGPDSVASVEPGVNYTHAPQVWALGYTGQGIVVAGADTGYRWDHTALKNHYRGWDGSVANHDHNWHDSIHSNAGTNPCGFDSPVPCDDQGHGTHTMGTAIGDDGQGNQIGMAPGAKWIGCRNMDANNGTPARYIECMEFFLAPYPLNSTPAQGDPSKAPDISTNSWGCPSSEGCSVNDLKAAAEAQRAAGIMMVVAAGNGGNSGINDCSTVSDQPGTLEAVYSIGALNTGADTLASFNSIAIDPQSGSTGPTVRTSTDIYVGTDIGVYASTDGGNTFSVYSTGLPRVPVFGLAIQNPNRIIRAATHGRGWYDNTVSASAAQAPVVLSVVSRLTHGGGTGTFDVNMPLTGRGIEPRMNGTPGTFMLVVRFTNTLAANQSGATITYTPPGGGTGSVSTVSTSGTDLVVQLGSVSNAQIGTLSVSNVMDANSALQIGTVALPIGFLIGDVNATGRTDNGDAIVIRNLSGSVPTASNPQSIRADVDLSGRVDNGDAIVVRNNSGAVLPP